MERLNLYTLNMKYVRDLAKRAGSQQAGSHRANRWPARLCVLDAIVTPPAHAHLLVA